MKNGKNVRPHLKISSDTVVGMSQLVWTDAQHKAFSKLSDSVQKAKEYLEFNQRRVEEIPLNCEGRRIETRLNNVKRRLETAKRERISQLEMLTQQYEMKKAKLIE